MDNVSITFITISEHNNGLKGRHSVASSTTACPSGVYKTMAALRPSPFQNLIAVFKTMGTVTLNTMGERNYRLQTMLMLRPFPSQVGPNTIPDNDSVAYNSAVEPYCSLQDNGSINISTATAGHPQLLLDD